MSGRRIQELHKAPLEELLMILLRQFKTLIAPIEIKDTMTFALRRVENAPLDAEAEALRERLIDLVSESERVLAGWDLSFAESLLTEMGDMPGWETTAEFLEIANAKSNAELRIAAGSVLLAALGDLRRVPYLLTAIAHDPDEVETVAAKRLLAQRSGIDPGAADWQTQICSWWMAQ